MLQLAPYSSIVREDASLATSERDITIDPRTTYIRIKCIGSSAKILFTPTASSPAVSATLFDNHISDGETLDVYDIQGFVRSGFTNISCIALTSPVTNFIVIQYGNAQSLTS